MNKATVTDVMRLLSSDVLIDRNKFAEATLALSCGHSEKAVEEFTRERIFWLLDENSDLLLRGDK